MHFLTRLRSYLLRMMRGILFRLMEHVLPVQANRWCFATWHGTYAHTLDNPRAVFEEVRNDPTIEKVILRREGQAVESTTVEGVNVTLVDIESVRGAYLLATAGCVLTGFALSGLSTYSRFLTARHRIIQLWHGIPLKRIGKLFPGEKIWDAETGKYAATVCSAPRDQHFMGQAFAPLTSDRVWQTGLPRNSTILKPEAMLPMDYQRDLEKLRSQLAGRRLILYAPTWRDRGVGIYEFTVDEDQALHAVLERHDAVLGVRAHANRRSGAQDGSATRVLSMNEYPDVNVLVREAAVLLTDYSSIYIDFLLTGKPIVHFTYDLESYVTERGFLYSLEDALATAPSLTAFAAIEQIDLALSGQFPHLHRYRSALELFHDHRGVHAAADVVAKIKTLPAPV